jgi:anti-sigma regulatory factor (Ser/Thr protein kinase)
MTAHAPAYRHEAMLWRSETEFLDGCVPFIRDGLERGEPVMVATTAERTALLVAALGPGATHVRFADMATLGANPACIIPAWVDFVRDAGGSPARGIGEPIWAGRSDIEIAECQLHESLLNMALPPQVPFWLVCPYDAGRLPTAVLEEAERSHPVVTAVGRAAPRTQAYAGPDQAHASFATELPTPAFVDLRLEFGVRDLRALRVEVGDRARSEGIGYDRAADLALAVHELAANSVLHGGGGGVLRIWREPDSLVVEIADGGTVASPLSGRVAAAVEDSSGRGLWMVNHLCDLVQLRSSAAGTTVRVHTHL